MVPIKRPRYRLLMADDDPGFREVLRAICEPFFACIEAESGEEAIEIFEAEPVDLLLIDMHMRLLTGIETVRILKQRKASIPCILITADFNAHLRQDAIEAEAYSVLAKPVKRRDLLSTLSTALVDTYDDPSASSFLNN